MAYETLAASYDRLTQDVPYSQILSFYERVWDRYGLAPETALDLACGTGSMALLLAQKGLRVLGADQSEEMLTMAADKAAGLDNPPYFIRQKMQNLRLPAPVDLIVCCLDGLNYVTKPEDVQKTFARAYAALRPGGLFLFDVNSEAKLRGLDGQLFLDEDDDVFCLWRADFNEKTRICTYGMDIFRREGAVWTRSREEHAEYAYRESELTAWLEAARFRVEVFGDRKLTPPDADEQRLFFAARKENTCKTTSNAQ